MSDTIPTNDEQIIIELIIENMHKSNINASNYEDKDKDGNVKHYRVVKRSSHGNDDESRYEICIGNPIGKGAFGAVFRADFVAKVDNNGKILKIKPSKKAVKILFDKVDQDEIKKEVSFYGQIHRSKKHMNKGGAHATFFKGANAVQQAAIVMRFIDGKELLDALRDNPKLNFATRLKIAANVVKAIKEMHEKDIVHRDLKLENLMINIDTLEVFIIDTGFAAKKGDKVAVAGTPSYIAPECYVAGMENRNVEAAFSQDYFSLSGILAEIFNATKITDRVFTSDSSSALDITLAMTNPYDYTHMFDGMTLNTRERDQLTDTIKSLGEISLSDRVENLNSCEKTLNEMVRRYETYSTNTENFIKQLEKKLESYDVNAHGDRGASIESIRETLKDAKELLDHKNEEGYNAAFAKVYSVYESIDKIAEDKNAKNFQGLSLKRLLAGMVTPISALAGLFSDDVKTYGLIKTTTSKKILYFKSEFDSLAQANNKLMNRPL